jgi:uncharacterized cupredoxin-like copper-binding protein
MFMVRKPMTARRRSERECMKSFTRWALFVVALALLATACSSDDGATTSLDVKLDSFEFDGSSWEVPAGQEITIELANEADIAHEWVILKPGVTITSEADLPATEEELLAEFVYWEEEVESGDTQTFTFTAPPAGVYQVVCAIEDHYDAGMEGELTVSAP